MCTEDGFQLTQLLRNIIEILENTLHEAEMIMIMNLINRGNLPAEKALNLALNKLRSAWFTCTIPVEVVTGFFKRSAKKTLIMWYKTRILLIERSERGHWCCQKS